MLFSYISLIFAIAMFIFAQHEWREYEFYNNTGFFGHIVTSEKKNKTNESKNQKRFIEDTRGHMRIAQE